MDFTDQHAADCSPSPTDIHLAPFARTGLDAPHLDSPLDPTHDGAEPLGWGVVGPGSIAERVVPDIARLPDARLIAVSSRSPERARAFADRHGFRHAHGDTAGRTGLEALAADPEVDVVYVASPHGYHHTHVSTLLKAGKHVVCEKALAITAREVEDLIRIAGAQGVLLMEAVWTAMTPGFRRAMHLVADGAIGTVHGVTGSIGFNIPPDPGHRLFAPEDGGGVTLDMLVYPLLWSDAVQGEILSRSVLGHLGPTEVDDDLAVQLRREHGWAQLSATLTRVPTTGIALSGTHGWLRADGRLHNPPRLEVMTTDRLQAGGEPLVEEITVIGAGYVPQFREATRCIRQGLTESPFVPWELSRVRARLFDDIRADIGLRLPHDEQQAR